MYLNNSSMASKSSQRERLFSTTDRLQVHVHTGSRIIERNINIILWVLFNLGKSVDAPVVAVHPNLIYDVCERCPVKVQTHFEDAAFLPGDLLDGVSEDLSVVDAERRDAAHPRPPVITHKPMTLISNRQSLTWLHVATLCLKLLLTSVKLANNEADTTCTAQCYDTVRVAQILHIPKIFCWVRTMIMTILVYFYFI